MAKVPPTALPDPAISVVVAAHNRAQRLQALLDSLRCQTIDLQWFELVIVDDASTDDTPRVLARELERSAMRLRIVHRKRADGPAAARNDGWRAASAPLIAFIDDDCVATPEWLEHGLRACQENPGAIVQGRVDPIPAERAQLSPFTRTLRIDSVGPFFQTCNIFYPKELLASLDGFDTFFTMPGGEDTDLAWRAISSGTPAAYAAGAQAYHAVNRIGPLGRLRVAWHWHESMLVYKRFPVLRQALFVKRVFWKDTHYTLARVFVALMLRGRARVLRPYLVVPYLRTLEARRRSEHGDLRHALFYPLEDLVELAAMLRASVEHRMLVL